MKDPFNLIITGVGGQGNVLASQIIGRALVKKGYLITVGETYGLSQRGGAVSSHIRISSKDQYGPVVPLGMADVILGLEPVESLRILAYYGQPQVWCVVNSRPIFPIGVNAGDVSYPDLEVLKNTVEGLTKKLWWIPAADIAAEIGGFFMTNVVMLGALAGTGALPLDQDDYKAALKDIIPPKKLEINLAAFDRGLAEGRA
ncbi:MAG: indolepyruvate oxidoreductase subunit beta [Deltaproteobacteria bacterium]|nr:indolepyruvate oxidoreductase subunit beta [Deltaproteobacteria bacterium]